MIHKSVLLKEAIDILNIKADGIYIDCTLGRAGHSKEILSKLTTGKLICFEQDEQAIKESKDRLAKISNNFEIINTNFRDITAELALLKIPKVDGILYDLGVSSPQLDESSRGFSYFKDNKLDMRMNKNQNLSAIKVVNDYPLPKLVEIFKKYGEEKFSYPIAKNIVKYREDKKIITTLQLVEIIKNSLPQKVLKKKGHPARKVFQAIRIEVNDELNSLEISLKSALRLLNKNGIIAAISFHSLEDKIIKNIFKDCIKDPNEFVNKKLPVEIKWDKQYELITRRPIIPLEKELVENNRSRSAKLRAIKKL